jgi:hypothetical protein
MPEALMDLHIYKCSKSDGARILQSQQLDVRERIIIK